MTAIIAGNARAVANTARDSIVATVDVPTSPERTFRALASPEITDWWVKPGVFDTREWMGDVRPGGTWRATGEARGRPYALEGEFLETNSPRRLVHTWRMAGVPGAVTTVSYDLEPVDGGTRITLRHSGFTSPEGCDSTALGWQTSFNRLAELLSAEHG
jgi:uncharacterized protein YndB with AHSA1/START domain